jgi:hypothetical protein
MSAVRIVRPSPGREHAPWVIVGPIAAISLVCGLLVPRACGLNYSESAAPSNEPSAAASGDLAQMSASASKNTPSAQPSPSPSPAAPTGLALVAVNKSSLLGCQKEHGSELKKSKCGEHDLDKLFVPILQHLDQCKEIEAITGNMTLNLDVRFKVPADNDKLSPLKIEPSRRSSLKHDGKLDEKAADPLIACIRKELTDAITSDTTDRPFVRYRIAYPISIAPLTGDTDADVTVKEKPMTGNATMQIDTIVRAKPNLESSSVDKLLRGTHVTLVGSADEGRGAAYWFHIRFKQDTDTKEGWVQREAIVKSK